MVDKNDHERAAIAKALQASVFGSPNVIAANSFDELSQSLRWHAQGHEDRPVLLPFKAEGEHLIAWYVCSHTGAMMQAVIHELGAFLGPSYIQIAPTDRAPDDADKHMLSHIKIAGWHAVRFSAYSPAVEQTVAQQWQRYWRLLDRRPIAASHVPQTFDQVRAAFDRALAARNEPGARSCLVALRERFGLSAENRLFLDIRLNAAFGKWDEIVSHRLLPMIVHLRLPAETYGDVMEALYESEVAAFERAPRVEELLDRFRETLAETAKPMFRTRRTSRRPAVLKAFVLFELIQAEPGVQSCNDLLRELPTGSFGALDAALRAHIAGLSQTDTYHVAQHAISSEQFDRAYDLLWPLADGEQQLLNLVLCARESEDPEKARAVLNRLMAAPEEMRLAVEAGAPSRVNRLRALAVKLDRNERRSLVEEFEQRSGEATDEYVERWRELARSSDLNDLLTDPKAPMVASECLTRLVVENPALFDRLHALWHELFVGRMEPDRRLIPIYVALMETLRARGDFSETDRRLMLQTLSALVMAGPDVTTYRTAVDEVHEVFKEVRSPHVMTWALDVCDTLAVAPTRDTESRMRMLLSVQQSGIEYATRLTPMVRALLRMLLSEAGIEVAPTLMESEQVDADSNIERSDVRLLAVYSLDEAAAKRAAQLLGELYPQLKIERSSDAVCTPRLKTLAQHADLFVFAWKSSKHAAYDCVKVAVKDKSRLIMAEGGGTTSLVVAASCQLA